MDAIHQSDLPLVSFSHEFIGAHHGDTAISFFLVNGEPGRGTRLHKHDYDEVVYVIEGQSTWTVADTVRQARTGDILIVRAGEPHKFVNSGSGVLRQIDIHLNPRFETTWLED